MRSLFCNLYVMATRSVFEHRRSLLQKYATSQLERSFPAVGKVIGKLKQFKKTDDRKSGKFCLVCFIEEMHKVQLVNFSIGDFIFN